MYGCQGIDQPLLIGNYRASGSTNGISFRSNFDHGSKLFDAVWVVQDLLVINIHLFQVGFSADNHRMFAINITNQSFTRSHHLPIQCPHHHQLRAKSPQTGHNYNKIQPPCLLPMPWTSTLCLSPSCSNSWNPYTQESQCYQQRSLKLHDTFKEEMSKDQEQSHSILSRGRHLATLTLIIYHWLLTQQPGRTSGSGNLCQVRLELWDLPALSSIRNWDLTENFHLWLMVPVLLVTWGTLPVDTFIGLISTSTGEIGAFKSKLDTRNCVPGTTVAPVCHAWANNMKA